MLNGSSSAGAEKSDGGKDDPTQSKNEEKNKTPEQRIRTLEAGIRQNMIRNCNNLVDLMKIIKQHGPATSKAVHATRRAIVLLSENASSPELKQWLSGRIKDYGAALVSILGQTSLVAHHDASVASAALAPQTVFRMLVTAALFPSVDNRKSDKDEIEGQGILESCVKLIHVSLSKFPDLAHIAFTTLASKTPRDGQESTPVCQHPVHLRIAMLNAASQSPVSEDNAAVRKIPLAMQRKSRTAGWLSVLQDQRLTLSQRRLLVIRLPTDLIPYMGQPLQLADFLTSCYNASANNPSHLSLSLSSLHGLYTLISKHNLDYPRFFQKLYALLSPDTFSTNTHESNQFRSLAAAFLIKGGTRSLPRNTAAAFVKRLVRRSLTAPSAHALWTLRLALELLRTYPGTSFLVHAPPVNLFVSDPSSQSKKRPRSLTWVSDPFDDSQNDPDLSNVQHSSLWELDVLRNHFSPAVSRLVTLFATDMRQRPPPLPGTLEDYSTLDFSDLWHAEVKRRSKTMHVAYDKPGTEERPAHFKNVITSSISWT